MSTLILQIAGMHCQGCASRIHTVLEREYGVRQVDVSFDEGTVTVSYIPEYVDAEQLRAVVESAGFGVDTVT